MKLFLTEHAKKRILQRYITTDDIKLCLEHGTQTAQDHKIKFTYKNIIIVAIIKNNTITIITVHYHSRFNKIIKKSAHKNKISFRQALKLYLDKWQ